jgi:hypothetical protein
MEGYVLRASKEQAKRTPQAFKRPQRKMSATTEITLEQLASVDAKLLFQALEMRLASAGILKKRSAKKAAKPSSSAADDAASETSRSVGEGTKKWNDQTKVVAALVKEALAGEKGGAGFHLKVLSYLKTEKSLAADAEPSLDQVTEAVTFLRANADWVSPNQRAKAAKAAEAGSAASSSSAAAVKVVKKEDSAAEAPKKKGRPAKSPEEKEAEAAAKKAAKEAEAAAKKAAKEAEREAKKAEKKAGAKKPAAAKKAETPAKTAEEEPAEDSELSEIELEGVSYFWDAESGAVYENIDGHTGDRIGSWDGASEEISRD